MRGLAGWHGVCVIIIDVLERGHTIRLYRLLKMPAVQANMLRQNCYLSFTRYCGRLNYAMRLCGGWV